MSKRLAETHDIRTVEDAKEVMSEIRQITCDREIVIARAEKLIAEITAQAMRDTSGHDERIKELEEQLCSFIMSNPDMFDKPRSVKTQDGKFGLRDSSRLEITDKDALLDCLMDRGYEDCLRISRSINKGKISNRITEHNETFPGCHVSAGEIAFYTVSKALIDEAKESI